MLDKHKIQRILLHLISKNNGHLARTLKVGDFQVFTSQNRYLQLINLKILYLPKYSNPIKSFQGVYSQTAYTLYH